MHSVRLLSLALFVTSAGVVVADPAEHARHPLPPGARVSVLKIENAAKGTDEPAECRGFHLTEVQLRTRFRTYRELGPGEYHDFYAWYPCAVTGIIQYRGTTFHFDANRAHTLSTDWPDGIQKILGGGHDGDLSD